MREMIRGQERDGERRTERERREKDDKRERAVAKRGSRTKGEGRLGRQKDLGLLNLIAEEDLSSCLFIQSQSSQDSLVI